MNGINLFIIIMVILLIAYLNIVKTQSTFTFDQEEFDRRWNDENEIWFGQSTALTGQTRELGYPLMTGIQAAFREINELGGVWGGKKLRLYSIDDGYEPALCVKNTIDLLNNRTIFGLIGYMGTANTQAIMPLLTLSKMPYIGALTGGLFLRVPFIPNIINVRASYQDECAAMIEYLVNVKMVRRISIFYQNDAFGYSGVEGSTFALKPLGMNLSSMGTYERNTVNIMQAVEDIKKGNPQAIICMSTYRPTEAFVNTVKGRSDFDPNIIFMTGSFIGSNPLPHRSSIVITQAYPAPTNSRYPIVLSYQRAMKAINPGYVPSIVELEGYMAGKLVISVLTQRVSGDLTRENFVNLIYSSSTYIMDNQVVGPYTKCTTLQNRKGFYFFEEQITNPMVSHSLSASLAPNIKLFKRDVRSTDETYLSSCSCNQGLRSIWKTIQNDDNSFIEIGEPMAWDLPGSSTFTCLFDPSKISLPIVFGHTSDGSVYGTDFLMGLLAVFRERNDLQKGVRGRRIEVLSILESSNSSSLISATTKFLFDHDVVGLVGSKASEPVMKEFIEEFSSRFPNIVLISPFTSYDSPELRSTFFNNVALVTISARERILAVLNYGMNTLGLSRFSFIGSNSNDGQRIFSEFSSILSAFGLVIDSNFLFSMNQTLNVSTITDALSKDANPQAIIVSIPEDVTDFKYLHSILHGIRSIGLRSKIHVFCLFFRQVSWEIEISNLLSNPFMSSVNFYISQSFPYVKSKHTLIDSYNSVMSKYYDSNPTTLGAVEGFLVGSFIIEVLDNIPLTTAITGKSIYETLYSHKDFLRFQIPFGKFISGNCNLGMRSHYTYQYVDSSFSIVDNYLFNKERCGAQIDNILASTGIKPPIIFGGLYPSSLKSKEYDLVKGIHLLFHKLNERRTIGIQVHLYSEYYDGEDDMITKAKSLIEKYKVFAFLGSRLVGKVSSLRELLDSNQVTMIGSISGHPELRYPFSRYVINLRPSIVEEVVAATRYATRTLELSEPDVTVIHNTDQYWSSVVSNITYFYKISGEGISLSYKQLSRARRTTQWSESLGEILLVMANAVDTREFLQIYSGKSRLILIPSEILSSVEFKGFTFPKNVVSTSYLVSYLRAENTNIMAKDYIADFLTYLPHSNKTMESYEGYALATMVSSILNYMHQANIEMKRASFTSSLFQRSVFELGEDKFGPYGDTCLTSTETTSTRSVMPPGCDIGSFCGCNQGAKNVYLQYAYAIPNTTYKLDIDTCGLKPLIHTLSIGAIIGISIGAASCVVCTCIVLVLLLCCLRKDTSAKHAPKSGFITCAFTDVQNSTKLWEGNENAMRESLEIHNQIMRRNLVLYRGYEVKTNGDSFYVAFKDPYDAVLWSMAVQLDLLNATWPSELYHEWDCRQEWDSKTRKAYWSGLRVRIGLHYGKGECVFDKTMKRFDYFGTVVNKSARIEALAHGGQVCISEELFYKTRSLYKDVEYLDESNVDTCFNNLLNVDDTPTNSASFSSSSSFSKKKRKIQAEKMFSAKDLGVYPLKGLSESTRIFEIKCVEIQLREYPPLRVDPGELERTRSSPNSMNGGSNVGSQQNLLQQDQTPKHEKELSDRRKEDVCEYTLTSIDNTLHP